MIKPLYLLSLCFITQTSLFAQAVLTIDVSKVTAHVSPTLYGLMTEEINYSYEGGLHGELIQNRIFRDDAKEPKQWSVVQENIPTQTWQPPTHKTKPGEPPATPPPSKQVPTLYYVATKDSKSGAIYLKVVNTASTAQSVQINLHGAAKIKPERTLITLSSGNRVDTNSISEPTKIVPVTSKASGLGNTFTQTFAPYSINVLQVETQ